jgi:hypothetical protein
MLKNFELITVIVHMQQGNFRIVDAEVALNIEVLFCDEKFY